MDHPKPHLRIIDIRDIEPATTNAYGRSVVTLSGEQLGHVDGFVVDDRSGRPSHIVVNAGGWFTSKYFLLPMQSARRDEVQRRVVADLSWEEAKNIPGFDKAEFISLSEDELARLSSFTRNAWRHADLSAPGL